MARKFNLFSIFRGFNKRSGIANTMTLGGKPRSLEFEEDEEEQKPRDAKSALKDINAVDSSTVSLRR